jgi:pyruvate dehydrogenase E2 component (dihydrolipoamide acetyltransferase)
MRVNTQERLYVEMAIPIEMPKLGNTVEECLLAKWLKRVGDPVAEGELIAEIETDKATFELTAPAPGTLLATFYSNGDSVPVFANVCVLGTPGESIEKFRPKEAEAQPAAGTSPAAVAAPTEKQKVPSVTSVASAPSAPAASAAAQIFLSPRARGFAREHDFYPQRIAGTGPGGRVLERDLEQLYRESPRTSPLARKYLQNGYELRGLTSDFIRASDLGPPPVKVSTIRERIARRMRESLGTTAQYTMNTSADATGMLALRSRIKAQGRDRGLPDINLNEMVMFCAVKALVVVPELNVEFLEGKIYHHPEINLGFACDTPKGLLVPVVKDCRNRTIAELAQRIKTLTKQALDGNIALEDLSGGTFTVSNLGIFGIESFSPILNPPQVAILGVNTIELKPVRREGGAVEFVDHIGLSLTCDHQVIDGAPGARFLKVVREQIEKIEEIAALGV